MKATKEMKPNLNLYQEQRFLKQIHGSSTSALAGAGDLAGKSAAAVSLPDGNPVSDDFYRDANSLAYAAPDDIPSKDSVDKAVQILEKQYVHNFDFNTSRLTVFY